MASEAPVQAPKGLGDFFSSKSKKKIKGSNLNNNTTATSKEAKKQGKKDAEEDGWEEQEVVAATIKVEVAGKLTREEDNKDTEDTAAPAWGSVKNKESNRDLSDKKYPTLAKSVQSSNINIDDGSNPTINIQTSKNAFSALENLLDSDDDGPKRPKEIKPAMVKKKKGEFEKAAVQREVDKYQKKDEVSKKKKKNEDDSDDDDDSEEEEEPEEKPTATEFKKKKKTVEKKVEEVKVEEVKEVEEDVKIQPDLAACKEKYAHRRKLPKVELPEEELEEPKKAAKVAVAKATGGKKKKNLNLEEDVKKKPMWVEE